MPLPSSIPNLPILVESSDRIKFTLTQQSLFDLLRSAGYEVPAAATAIAVFGDGDEIRDLDNATIEVEYGEYAATDNLETFTTTEGETSEKPFVPRLYDDEQTDTKYGFEDEIEKFLASARGSRGGDVIVIIPDAQPPQETSRLVMNAIRRELRRGSPL